MPIRVEYGPSAVAVGELAFRTGQNEYIAKRRKELEELAQRQAEMRQRSMLAQQSLQADLYKFHGAQQTAMQQLQFRQQEFQQRGMQFDLGQQHALKLAEDRRQHDLKLEKIHGEQKVADARMRHGLAQDRDFNALQNNNLVRMFKTHLNEPGQEEGFKFLKAAHDALNDPRIEPTEAKRIYNENIDKANALKDDARYTIDKELQPGYSEGWGAQDGGYESNTPYTRTRKQNGEWEYRQNYSYYDQDENGEWQERQLTPEEWTNTYRPNSFIDDDDQRWKATDFNLETGQWNYAIDETYDPNAEANAAKAEAAENEERINKRLEMYNKYVSGLLNQTDAADFLTWQQKTYGDTIIGGGQQPAPPEQPAAPPDPEAAAAPPQPAPAPAAGGLYSPEEQAEQQQNAANLLEAAGLPPMDQPPPEQQVQPDQPAGPVQNPAAPIGSAENPHQVINQAEAERMVQNGEIQPGDVVTTADGIQFSAGEPPLPPSVVAAREARGDREAREAEMRAREDAAMAEQLEAQRLDAIEAAKRKQSIYSPQELLRQQQNAASLLQRTGLPPYYGPSR